MSALQTVLDAIDELNTQDPNTEMAEGVNHPKELLYSQRMSKQLLAFCPEASELLQIAARAQHIQRWTLPRSDYPMDRSGYKQWRTTLAKFHADTTADLMATAGYSEADQARVKFLLQKKSLKTDTEVQTLEDVICLVFIEHYLTRFAEKHSEEKLIDIIRKTWAKMSDTGHAAALQLPLSESLLALVGKALAG